MKRFLCLLITILMTFVTASTLTACSFLDFFNSNSTEEEEPPVTTTIEYFVTEGSTLTGLTVDGKKLEKVVIPETIKGVEITAIGTKAFYDNQKVKTVELPNSITVIGDEAFYGCKKMTQINLPDTVTYLGKWAFYGCSNLQSINIPSEISEIKENTFRECRSLSNVEFPNGITKIGNKAFEKCIAFTSIHLSASIQTLENDAFTNCNGVTAFSVDSNNNYFKAVDGNLYSKDGKTFYNYALAKTAKTFTVPEGVLWIEYAAFANEMELETINVASTVKSIGYECFSACQGLKQISFGGANSKLERIEHRAFFNAVQLYSIEVPETLNFVGSYAFSYCGKLSKIYSYKSATGWNNLSINTPVDNAVFTNEAIREYV